MTKIEIQLRSDDDDSEICSANFETEYCQPRAFDYGFPDKISANDQFILKEVKKLVADYDPLHDKFRVYVQATAMSNENSEWEELLENEYTIWYVDTDKVRTAACDTTGWDIIR